MVFSSILFLFYFLPAVLITYFIAPKKYRNLILFIFSLFFYSWGEPKYIWIMLFSTVLDFTCGKQVHKYNEKDDKSRAKLWLMISIVINLGLLAFFKYSNFIIEIINSLFNLTITPLSIILPIGISFYTFQTMSYTIDVYKKETKVQDNIISFGTYVTLFPQLIAGPIVRYQTVAEEIDNRNESHELINEGINRFIIGLGKKVLLANNIGLLWREISSLSDVPMITAWIGILAFSFQIYFDFSGYSDMAIGLGKIFGFNFLENFDYPYISKSITEFWRRWHISLGTWFKEYVYIPLGGNRNGKWKHLRNIFIVWSLTGIWHGASWNFLLWGLYFAIMLIIEKRFLLDKLKDLPEWISRAYLIFTILVSWVIFAFDELICMLNYLKSMFNIHNIYNTTTLHYINTHIILLIVLIMASTPIPKKIWQFKKSKITNNNMLFILENGYLIFIFMLAIAYLVDQSYNPFLYFRF